MSANSDSSFNPRNFFNTGCSPISLLKSFRFPAPVLSEFKQQYVNETKSKGFSSPDRMRHSHMILAFILLLILVCFVLFKVYLCLAISCIQWLNSKISLKLEKVCAIFWILQIRDKLKELTLRCEKERVQEK